MENPLADVIAQRKRDAAFRYPFRVVCVFEDAETSDFPIITAVREHCAANALVYGTRQYNPDTHPEDIPVSRLPAFHVWYKGSVQDTYYHDTDPVYALQRLVWAYEDELRAIERARIRRQQRWDAFVDTVRSAFVFKRKRALDPDRSLHRSGVE